MSFTSAKTNLPATATILLKKVRVHNLKEVDLELPQNQLIVFTGVSGSGKSSLAFDTIYVEGQRRYVESLSTHARRHFGNLPKPDAEKISGISPTVAIEQKTSGRNPRSTVGTLTGIYDFLRVLYARIATPHCPVSGEPVQPQSAEHILRSITALQEAGVDRILVLSPYCRGKKGEFKEDFPDLLKKGFSRIRLDGQIIELAEEIDSILVDGKVAHDVDLVIDRLAIHETHRLTESVSQALELGQGVMSVVHPDSKQEWLFSEWAYSPKSGISYPPLEPSDFSFNHPAGMCPTCQGLGSLDSTPCPSCEGTRLKPYPAAAQLKKMRIADLCRLPIDQVALFFNQLSLTSTEQSIAEELVKEITERLFFLQKVGLGYLSLERTAPTLSGGESQRVRLASHIGSGLVGATYVLDEPSIGLHPRDNSRLLETLCHLKNRGNTVIVVEHDEETIRIADYIVDVGPYAGARGGEILVSGSYEDLLASKTSITGSYLSGRREISIPLRRSYQKSLWIQKAKHHNLKEIDVEIPLGVLVAITGVSGSGKSSLISDTLYPALANALHKAELPVGQHQGIKNLEAIDKVIAIDQTPIGRTPRSNPATYIKLFDEIRDLFSQLPESVAKGYDAGRFSFNVKKGACSHCSGMGMIKIDMDFMEDAWILCEECRGQRFDEATLSIRYRGKSIYDILKMSVDQACEFFTAIPSIRKKLETLQKVGLNYIQLGQPSPTLSGGEAQRIKLAKELARPASGDTFYILDEPTTGLHIHDIAQLILVLQALVDRGNTVLVIEHQMDLVKVADWVIDLGPEGGDQGGTLIGAGPPEEIAKLQTPTGKALYTVLNPPQVKPPLPKPPHTLLQTQISIRGATQNNLKRISTTLPRGKITICTGPSGSGKSSFAFETLYAEGQRRYIESLSPYARQFVQQMPKPKVDLIEGLSPSIAIEQKNHAGNPRSTVGTMTEIYDFLRVLYARLGTPYCPETKEKIQTISKTWVLEQLLSLPENTKLHLLSPLSLKRNESLDELKERLQRLGFLRIRLNGTYYELDEEIPFSKGRKNALFLVIDRLIIHPKIAQRLLEGIEQATELSQGVVIAATEKEDLFFNLAFAVLRTGKSYPPITPHTFSFNTPEGMCPECEGLGCSICEGSRLNPLARHVLIKDLSIADLCRKPIDEVISFLQGIPSDSLLQETLDQLHHRLHFLQAIGLNYISLDRTAPTLSGGETQRIRLARQLGSGLTGVLYVLDEPTVGLHPRDTDRLNEALQRLCQLGNTLVLVEHDPLTMKIADHFIDFGPKAGKEGGTITAEGSLEEIKQNPHSLTGAYLSGRKTIPIPTQRRAFQNAIEIKHARLHNLKNIHVLIPTGIFTCVTGVSGSGKSTLINDLLRPAVTQALQQKHPPKQIAFQGATFSGINLFDQLVALDQNPIGHTQRADVSTYVDLFTSLRYFFAELPEAKIRGLKPRHFSFNHRKGMCTACWGLGVRNIPLQFLPSVKVTCDACRGYRLNPLSLQVKFKHKHLGHILQMTIEEARSFLPPIPKVIRILDTLLSVGLGYLTLGQEIATLSGGEAQRLRLSRELSKRTKKRVLYLLDEPTVGLHSEDIVKLLQIFHALIDQGHSLVVIEHNLDVIQNADYLIDMGPESGHRGGQVVATGTPEELANNPNSITGTWIKRYTQEHSKVGFWQRES